MDINKEFKFEKIEIKDLITEEEIDNQIKQVLKRKETILRQMKGEEREYGAQPYASGHGVARFGSLHDKLQEELVGLDGYLKQLIIRLWAVAGKDSSIAQKYEKLIKRQ